MPRPTQTDLRELILRVAHEQQPRGTGGPTLQQGSVLNAERRGHGKKSGHEGK